MVRATLGGRNLGASIGVAALGSSVLEFNGFVPFRVIHLPIDLSLRAALRRGAFEVTADAGPLLSLVYAPSAGLSRAVGAAPGLHLGLSARYWINRRWAAVAGASLDWSPSVLHSTNLSANADQPFPDWWVGGALGVVMNLR